MSAKSPTRRKRTAREMADALGANPRTIRRLIAEPRSDYELRAAEKKARAQDLRKQKMTHKEIAEELGVPIGSVSSLLRDDQTRKAS